MPLSDSQQVAVRLQCFPPSCLQIMVKKIKSIHTFLPTMFESDYFPRLYCFQIYLKRKENTVHISRYYEDRCEDHRESTDWIRQGMNALLIRQGHKEKCNVLPQRGILSVLISPPLCSREPLCVLQ